MGQLIVLPTTQVRLVKAFKKLKLAVIPPTRIAAMIATLKIQHTLKG